MANKRERRALPVPPLFVLPFLSASLAPDFSVTVTAVHRSPFSGLEGHLRLFATRGANSVIHFPLPLTVAIPGTIRTTALLFSGLSALRAALGLISEALVSEELLLLSSKGETCAALHTLEVLVHVVHGWPPFFRTWLQFGHPWPGELMRNRTGRELQTFNLLSKYGIETEACQVMREVQYS